jgi:hypothetical protein
VEKSEENRKMKPILHDIVSGWFLGKKINESLKNNEEPEENSLKTFETLQKSTQTTLSKTVQQFLIIEHDDKEIDYDEFLTKDSTRLLNFEMLTFEKLTAGLSEEDLKDESKVFKQSGEYIKKVSKVVHNYFLNHINKEVDFKSYSNCFELLDEKKEEILFSTLKYHMVDKKSLFAFQFVVPFIERNLQNILFGSKVHKLKSKGKKIDFEKIEEEIPTKISELLSDSNMIQLFGKDIVFLFRLLIGPLHGVNLRNVTLHGFMTTNEWYPGFTSLILMIIFSVSSQCKELREKFEITFDQRPFEECPFKLYKKPLLSMEDFKIKELESIMDRSLFVIPNVKDQWKEAILSYEKKEYYHCLVYLFPLIEHSIRRIYVCSNDCAERLLTAEQHSLYTTLDILLTEYMSFSENKEDKNQIFNELGRIYENVLWDVFLWEECPRIRDMLSHGGCDPFKISQEIADYILSVSLALIVQYDIYNTQQEEYNKKLPLIMKESYSFFEEDYIPIYHPKHVVERYLKGSRNFNSNFICRMEFPELLESKYTYKIIEELKNDIELVQSYLCFSVELKDKWMRKNDLIVKNRLIYGVVMDDKEYKKAIKMKEILNSCDENLKSINEHYDFLWDIIVSKKSTTQHRKHLGQLVAYTKLFVHFFKLSIDIVETEFNHQEDSDQEFLTKVYNNVVGMEMLNKSRKFRQAYETLASFVVPSTEIEKIKFGTIHKKFVDRNFGEILNYQYLKK